MRYSVHETYSRKDIYRIVLHSDLSGECVEIKTNMSKEEAEKLCKKLNKKLKEERK